MGTRTSWRKISTRCSNGPSRVATWRHRCAECISQRQGLARRRGRSAYRPSRTRCCNGRYHGAGSSLRAEFLNCSYGFRPGRSAHQALRIVQSQTVKMAGRWVLEIDVRRFFETLDHGHLRSIVRKRVRDGMLLRLIDKWLKAGVMEDGTLAYPYAGTPQGGCVSPILA